MLNCTNLITSFKSKNPDLKYLAAKNKRKYECNLNDITAREIKFDGDKCLTNKNHIKKRQKI